MRKNLQKVSMILGTLLWMIMALQATAQEVQVKGKVTDASTTEEMPGVSIVIAGTTKGVISGSDGTYQIAAPKGAKLLFSFIGYTPVEMTVSDAPTIDVALQIMTAKLDEVIVIGYGIQKKSDKTGAVTSVAAAELNTGVLSDPIQSLQGKASGVQISKKGGNPNDGFSVQIRGSAGFVTGNEPLYVIDGVPGADPTTVASEDIESFNILKDASACAIYGSRGANGVIIITTKKGKSGANQITFDSYIAMEQVAKRLDLLSASDIRSFIARNHIDQVDAGGNTDWQNEIYRNALTQNYSLAISGGNDKSNYRISGNLADYQGVVLGNDKNRFNGSVNVTQKLLNDKLIVDGSMFETIEKNEYQDFGANRPTDILYQAFQRSPLQPAKNPDGSYYENTGYGFQYFNPLAIINDIQNTRSAKRFLGSVSAELELLKGLKIKANGSYKRNDDESFYFVPSTSPTTTNNGKGQRSFNNDETKLLETFLTYNATFAEKHALTITGGYSWQDNTVDGFGAMGTNAQSPSITSNNLKGLANVTWGSISSYKNEWNLISFFGRAFYSYDQRYSITGTVRRDGSSKFGQNNKWGIFPSGSVAWNLKNESFLKDVSLLSQLKLRLGYGQTGNTQGFSSYWSIAQIIPSNEVPSLDDGSNVIAFYKQHDSNPNLKWEVLEEYNMGIDYGFFNNKLQGSVELYDRNTKNMIYEYALNQPPSNTGKVFANAGQISNKGIEVNIQIQVVDTKNVNYKTSFTFSRNINKIIKLSDLSDSSLLLSWNRKNNLYIQARGMVGQYTQYIIEGLSLGTWWLPHFTGYSADGKPLYKTTAGGITRDISNTSVARYNCGSATPKINFGWSNYFILFRNFDINISLHAVLGYKVYNVSKMYFSDPALLPNFNANKQAVFNYENNISGTPVASDQWLEDGSFVRLDNITIGYNLPIQKKLKINKLRFYVTANNLHTFTNYTGIDPELSYSGIEYGLDNFNVYPKTRSYVFGIQLTF